MKPCILNLKNCLLAVEVFALTVGMELRKTASKSGKLERSVLQNAPEIYYMERLCPRAGLFSPALCAASSFLPVHIWVFLYLMKCVSQLLM